MNVNTLYHCTHRQLNVGDIVQPGNWGNIIKATGSAHPSWNRESALELMRMLHFRDKPSRFNCTFCCDNLETMMCYRWKNTPNGYIYKVEIIDTSAPYHKGDFNAVEPMPRHSADMQEIAFRYWQYSIKTSVAEWPGIECSEILSASSLHIVDIAETSLPITPEKCIF